MGDLRDYLREYWRRGLTSYRQSQVIMNVVVMGGGALAFFGLQWAALVPAWAAPAWIATYVIYETLLVWPYRSWKEQRDQIKALKQIGAPLPDYPIKDLFFHIQPDLLDHQDQCWWEVVGLDIRDKLSTSQLRMWGRESTPMVKSPPLTLIDPAYWRHADFSYVFLTDGSEQNEHAGHFGVLSDIPSYRDLRVNRAEAMKIWPR